MRRYRKYNPKRRIAETGSVSKETLARLADVVTYSGNPEHKKSPGDFRLQPPASPRPGKSLCDTAGIFRRTEALKWLREGLMRGIVSASFEGEWPKQVWAVTEGGVVLEAQRDRAGSYHGYPIPPGDAFQEKVIEVWNGNND